MKKIWIVLLNSLVVCLLIALPYYIFQGKLFVGGDDTRLQYVFPWHYLQHMAFFSWNNISSISYYNPNQFSIPLLSLLTLLQFIFRSTVIVDYIAFSAPLILGFIYFQLLLKAILPEVTGEVNLLSALFFIFSPILIQNQLAVFLTPVWLIALIPILGYYLLRYVKTGNIRYVTIAVLWSIVLSIALYTIPWILGFVLPFIIISPIFVLSSPRIDINNTVKKSLIFFSFIFISQSFWLLPFLSTFIGGGNAIGSKVLSSDVAHTFRSTVLSTAIGNTFYPLATLFHRQIIEVFNWQTKSVFEAFYDKIAFFNIFYIALIISPFFLFTNKVVLHTKRLYIVFFLCLLVSLYLFTVNIGPFREFFLLGGYIPGFVMFRNFYDKFALGFVFIYAIVFGFAYHIIQSKYPKIKPYLFGLFFLLIIGNSLPIKAVVNSPLWTTQHVYRVINFPKEYIDFLNKTKKVVPPSTNILSIPMGIAAYTVVTDEDGKNVYAGTSPIKILTGINDYSGDLSFSPDESGNIGIVLKNKEYNKFNTILKKYNTSYILVTKNIPEEVKKSYLFASGEKFKDQDEEFIANVVGEKVLTSSKGNYELYKAKNPTGIFELDKGQIYFEKVSSVHYVIQLKHVSSQSALLFRDSFHKGWKMFLSNKSIFCKGKEYVYSGNNKECIENEKLFNLNDLTFLWKKPIQVKQIPVENFGQKWLITTIALPNNASLIKKNEDGTVDFTVELYFKPQVYFYIGSLLSIFTFIILFFLSFRRLMKK